MAEEEALRCRKYVGPPFLGCCKFFRRDDGTVMLTGTESSSASPRLLPPPNLTKSNGEEGASVLSVILPEFSGVLAIGRVGTEVSSIATTVIGAIEISTDRFVHIGNA